MPLQPDAMVGALASEIILAYTEVITYGGKIQFDKNVTRQVVTRFNPTAIFPGEQSIGGLADGTFQITFPNNAFIMRFLFWLEMTASVFPCEMDFGVVGGGFSLNSGTAFITDISTNSIAEQPQDNVVTFRWDVLPTVVSL